MGETSDEEMQALEVRLDWGRVKQAFVIRAMKNQLHNLPELQEFFKDTFIIETGFTSCANGCVAPSKLRTCEALVLCHDKQCTAGHGSQHI